MPSAESLCQGALVGGAPVHGHLAAPVQQRARKVLILTDDLGGGTGTHVLRLVRHWDKAAWRARIVSAAPRTTHLIPEIPVTYLPPLKRLQRFPFVQLRRLNQVRRVVRRARPDLVHAYFFWPILYARLLKKAGLIQYLVENREDQGFGWGKSEYRLLKLTRGATDEIICVSEGVRQVVLEREGVDPNRTRVVRNGIEVGPPQECARAAVRRALGFSADHLVVGMVANYNRPIKGVTHFLDAIPLILQSVPNARFVIIGDGGERNALVAKAERLGVADKLALPGYCANMAEQYSAMDVSVLTSLSEGLSITLLESMNFSLPVVATHVGGNPEVVIDGETGFLVPPKDPSAFASKVISLLQDTPLKLRMGAAGRERVRRHFCLQVVAGSYLKAYEQVLGESGARNPRGERLSG